LSLAERALRLGLKPLTRPPSTSAFSSTETWPW
jgi:hypothetical protein